MQEINNQRPVTPKFGYRVIGRWGTAPRETIMLESLVVEDCLGIGVGMAEALESLAYTEIHLLAQLFGELTEDERLAYQTPSFDSIRV